MKTLPSNQKAMNPYAPFHARHNSKCPEQLTKDKHIKGIEIFLTLGLPATLSLLQRSYLPV